MVGGANHEVIAGHVISSGFGRALLYFSRGVLKSEPATEQN
jgi:hypothetical protein